MEKLASKNSTTEPPMLTGCGEIGILVVGENVNGMLVGKQFGGFLNICHHKDGP